MKTKILLLIALLLATGTAAAQQDSLRKVNISGQAPGEDSESRWSVGGYGEMLTAFKDYGLNRYYGGEGNTRKNRGLVVKADYTMRQIGTHAPFAKGAFTSENEFRIGIAYALWFSNRF